MDTLCWVGIWIFPSLYYINPRPENDVHSRQEISYGNYKTLLLLLFISIVIFISFRSFKLNICKRTCQKLNYTHVVNCIFLQFNVIVFFCIVFSLELYRFVCKLIRLSIRNIEDKCECWYINIIFIVNKCFYLALQIIKYTVLHTYNTTKLFIH